jgi:hypothetical protein
MEFKKGMDKAFLVSGFIFDAPQRFFTLIIVRLMKVFHTTFEKAVFSGTLYITK